MNRQTFTWGRSENRIRKTESWIEGLWVLGLLLAALLLFGINLESLPLLSWAEGTVDLIARKIQAAPLASWEWLYPTLPGKSEYPQPPLLYWLIGSAYQMGGISPGMMRLPGAILSALSIPLLYGIGRELFPSRQSAIFSSLIYLTLLPVIYHGRLALLDGTVLCFVLLTMWCVLRSRRDLRWSLGIGIGLGLICLTQGILFGLLLGVIALVFLAWDTPRLLTSVYWWLGVLLGCFPGLAWYAVPLMPTSQILGNSGTKILPSLWALVNRQSRPFWYYAVEIFCVPWLLFWCYGLRLAWDNRNWGWGKLVLVWTGIYLLAIPVMLAKLSWYIFPVYPALALAGGAQLAYVWNLPSAQSYPRLWSLSLSLLALVAGATTGGLYFSINAGAYRSLFLFFASVALTMTVAAFLAARRNLQFIVILFWGTYISLLLLIAFH
ncbi:glycosyltransferase family 39 protein [Lyngbya aestuarii]|uniref:glycosyltransferase family 39 protein n=1 Tax=Lyngbya aestuarii TaxID=118322 RepID=UPI00403DED50